jgi:long-chain acyl-CoA synthetase
MLLAPLLKHAREQPQHLAIVDDRGRYTYEQLAAMVSGLGFYLSTQTRQPSIGLVLPASAGFVASFYGTLAAGKAVVPINFLLGEREIAHIIRDSGIDTILTAPPLSAKLEPFKATGLKIIDISALPSPPPGMQAPRLPAIQTSDLAVLMYTSGTSGLPKGVELTYGNLDSDVRSAIEHASLQGTHKFLGVLPLFHSTGLLATVIAPITLGSSVVYTARFSPVGTIHAIRDHAISIVAAVPSMYGAMARLKSAGPDDVKSLYAAISGGEPLPAAVREAFGHKFGVPIYEGYGLTETIGPIAFNVPGAIRPGSVGRLIPGAQARIADDDGNGLPTGQNGEIWLRGPMIMSGYHNLPEETAAAITPEGFFKSGDLGFIDSDGYLHVTGRKKDLIIIAGEKASPREIEDVLLSDPSVAEAAVLGRKDPSRGEVVVAFVTAKEGHAVKADELRDYCRQKGLVQWKIPREIRVVTELPHSPTGKVLKRLLAEQLAAEEGSASQA